jgi:hypothetical protein
MDERTWPEAIPAPGDSHKTGDATVTCIALPALFEVAGDIAAFAARHAAPELGLGGDIGPAGPALIRLGRDRALWRHDAAPTGYDGAGFAVLPLGGGMAGFAVTGAGAEGIARQGVALDLVDGSPSAAALWCGHRVILLRDGDGWQIWCAAPEAWAVWAWLTGGYSISGLH